MATFFDIRIVVQQLLVLVVMGIGFVVLFAGPIGVVRAFGFVAGGIGAVLKLLLRGLIILAVLYAAYLIVRYCVVDSTLPIPI